MSETPRFFTCPQCGARVPNDLKFIQTHAELVCGLATLQSSFGRYPHKGPVAGESARKPSLEDYDK